MNMFRVPLVLSVFFFVLSMILGVLASGNDSRIPSSVFWGSILLFLLFSSLTLSFYAPFWIALAPVVPAAIFAFINLYLKKAARGDYSRKGWRS
ncbi:MAG: hypothetical protein WC948_02500 [Thermovirgaceae bacterium]